MPELIHDTFALLGFLDVWLTVLACAASLGVSLLIVGVAGVVWPRFRDHMQDDDTDPLDDFDDEYADLLDGDLFEPVRGDR